MQNSCRFFVYLFSVSFFFNYLTITVTAKPSSINDIMLNCGSSGISTDPDGREWTGDVGIHSKFVSLEQSNNTFILSNPDGSSIDHDPYKTARIFHSQFIYTFRVSPGQKFIRLYFNPSTYHDNFDMSKAFFTVTTGPFTLLSNFSIGSKSLVKEFCANVLQNQTLNITFTPSTNTSYAFINGIEIVSMPTSLYYSQFGDKGARLVGHNSQFHIQNNSALEMIYRLNVGGHSISPINDSGKLFRKWLNDTDFFLASNVNSISNGAIQINYTSIPPYTAPKEVYQTARTTRTSEDNKRYNLTWRLPVDSGFKYLVRLHFCKIQPEVKQSSNNGFRISIRNKTVEISADVITWSGGQGIPVYRDYVVMIPNKTSNGKSPLFIELRPNANSSSGYSDAILNGLELFKLNNSDANLAAPNPEVPHPPSPSPSPSPSPLKSPAPQPLPFKYSKGGTKSVIYIEATVGVISVIFLLGLTIIWRRMRTKSIKSETPPILQALGRRFTLQEIKTATNNFDRNLIIGKGGFGYVLRGHIDHEHTPVAIKVFGRTSRQGFHEFQTEVEMLSKLRHPNLVSLIGYCDDERVMIIVYELMAHGALHDHLYNTDNPPLSWKQRLEICIGAARGILYLHEGEEHAIIHRDVKTSNILLDQNWVPKVSDFGISRLGPTRLSMSHVTTDVKGTFGYMDPEYFWTSHLTVKSDVYGFGVVLFEVLCARPAVDMGLDYEQQSLASWASLCFEEGKLDQIIDPHLIDQMSPESLKMYANIAYKCVCEDRDQRPKMVEVLRALEFAKELQEIADDGGHRVMINEEVPLCVGENQVVSRPRKKGEMGQSCPTFWNRSTSHKELLRFLSEKVGLKWVKSPKLGCFFAASEYNALPRIEVQLPDLSRCGPYSTPEKFVIEISKVEEL
ncbi:receptor-like protein kinase FERONIA isoform X6 [Quercus robur]|uniref:receptor-like protein kinase FERONIA isoform X6 n=1 Tax=Quercus robur TaxID=38942 RepID=UPI0021619B10|nr:receptor-like protein kinase FERONIA isoform X6 [Quercus robur]